MALKVIGLSHHTAPVEVRECFVFPPAQAGAALARLLEENDAEEAVLLSTCNRTELYMRLSDTALGRRAPALLAEHAGLGVDEAGRYYYTFEERRSAEHLFRVVSSLDSMIVGEAQIQGQVKGAYERAAQLDDGGKAAGPVLSRLFQMALSIGGKVRSETQLGTGAASIPSAAVELARKIFGDLRGRRAVVLGAGEMSELALECLTAEGVAGVVVANRTEARAKAVAERVGCRAVRFEELRSLLREAEIVVSATAAPHAVLTRELVEAALPDGPQHPLLIVDIALPRDVEPEVGEIPNVFLYHLDDLKQIVDANLERRALEVPKAERIVQAGVDEFWAWYAARDVVPFIRSMRSHAEDVRRAELEKALRRMTHLSEDDRQAVDVLTRQLLNKFLHSPTARLRAAAANGGASGVLDAARYLFALDRDQEEEETPGESESS